VNVRRAVRSEIPAVANVLARAFEDDPSYIAMFPTERVARTTKMITRVLDVVYFAHDDVWVTDDLRAAAVWAPPNQWHVSFGQTMRLLTLATTFGARSILGLRMLSAIESKHPKTSHHYLAFLGVDPDAQGRGLGGAVLKPVLERGGEHYLETTNPKNHGFYRRQGFKPIDTIEMPAKGVVATTMLRS
jgi:ribosomal protein S18 acetylase RimI-like enzyme